MIIDSVIFDFDGVFGLSKELAWEAGHDILRVFGCDETIDSMKKHRRLFGAAAQEQLVGTTESETLREMHRLAMRNKGGRIPANEELLRLASGLSCAKGIITAGYGETVVRCLKKQIRIFSFVKGREDGRKTDLLARCKSNVFSSPMYICDTVRDIRRCRAVGLSVCATAWGFAYDEPDVLESECPDWTVRNIEELSKLMNKLQLR